MTQPPWDMLSDIKKDDEAQALANALGVPRTAVEEGKEQRDRILLGLEKDANTPSAFVPGHEVLKGRDVETRALTPDSQAGLADARDLRYRQADIERNVASPVSAAQTAADQNAYMDRVMAREATSRADAEEDPRLRAAYARLEQLSAPKETGGFWSALRGAGGSVAHSLGGTDTFQANRARDAANDMSALRAAAEQVALAEKLGAHGRDAAARERDARLLELKAYSDAYKSAQWAQPIEGGPASVTPESRLTVGGSPASDVTGHYANAPSASAPSEAAASGPTEAPRAPAGTPKRALQNAMSWEDAKTKLGQIWSPSAPPTPDGTPEALGIGRPISAAPEPVSRAGEWIPPKYPVGSDQMQTRAGQMAYLNKVVEAQDKYAEQKAAEEKAGGGTTTRERFANVGPSGGVKDKALLFKVAQERGQELGVASSQRNVDAANNSREGIAGGKAEATTLKPDRIALTPSGGTELFKDSKTATYAQDLTGATDAYKKSLRAIIEKSATIGARALTHAEVEQMHADLHRDAIAVALKIDGSNRVNERVLKLADDMSGAANADDLVRLLPGRGGDVDAAMRGAVKNIDRTVEARIAALNGIPVEHVGEGRYRFTDGAQLSQPSAGAPSPAAPTPGAPSAVGAADVKAQVGFRAGPKGK